MVFLFLYLWKYVRFSLCLGFGYSSGFVLLVESNSFLFKQFVFLHYKSYTYVSTIHSTLCHPDLISSHQSSPGSLGCSTWPPCCFSIPPIAFLPQGLCTGGSLSGPLFHDTHVTIHLSRLCSNVTFTASSMLKCKQHSPLPLPCLTALFAIGHTIFSSFVCLLPFFSH